MNRKYLITGGCGFIGSHLANSLLNQGSQVRILDNLSTGKRENAPKGCEVIVGDIRDKKVLKKAVEGMDGCFHLAAVASMEKSILHLSETHEINMLGTVNLLEAILQSKKKIPIVYTSSAAVYGNPDQVPLNEEIQPAPLSPYGADKLAGERHLAIAWHLHQLPSMSFRLFNVYGKGQDPHSPYSGVISIFSEKIRKGEMLPIYGKGNQTRDFIYVGDVVRFLISGMEKMSGAHLFNLSTGQGITINELAHLLEKLTAKSVPKEYLEARKGDIEVSIGDPKKALSFFGMKGETSLEYGLKTLLED
jgi:UDP-glucose 4-epimerase